MKHESVSYACDKCGKKLTDSGGLNLVTVLSEISGYWSRLHVHIRHRSGVHNDGKVEDADLCKACAIELLSDALARVRKGERASAGTEKPDPRGWHG